MRASLLFSLSLAFAAAGMAQQIPQGPQQFPQGPQQNPQGSQQIPQGPQQFPEVQQGNDQTKPTSPDQIPTTSPVEQVRANYVLDANDQVLIRAFQVQEIGERPYRIDMDGNIDLPLVGTVKAGGLSVDQLEAELVKRLSTYVRNPQVSVTVVVYRSEPVFFIGAFRAPGIYTLQGKRTLVEMLSSIGGLQPYASRRITVTRRLDYGPIPLPNAVTDKAANTSTVEISMGSLHDQVNPAEDIVLQPYDQISVSRAEMVYIDGEVNRVGAVELGERDSLSVIQAISMSGGLTRDADIQKVRILRPVMNSSKRAEIPVNLKLILAGKSNDYPLLPNDLLYVPRSTKVLSTMAKLAPYIIPVLITTIIYTVVRP
jgi:polysaccharide biosynthesis/export protein